MVLVWPEGAPSPEAFVSVLRRTLPAEPRARRRGGGRAPRALARLATVAEGKIAVGGRTTAYVCERGQCRLPAIEPEKLASQVAPVRAYGAR